jgi:hypothetical protein
MNEKYFVYDKYGGHLLFDAYMLERFIVKNGPWCFGNNHKDKRWSFKVRRYFYKCCIKPVVEVEGEEVLVPVKYVVYDQDGELVTCKRIDQLYVQGAHSAGVYPYYRSRGPRWYYTHRNYPGFRSGPVPYTGGYGNGSYYRKVKTTQELRMNNAHKGFTRGKRRNIPSYYDDVRISDHYTGHSWKKQKKKKQWM